MSGRHSAIKESESTKCRRDTSARSRVHPPVRPACPGIREPPFTPEILVAARAASKDCNVPRNACLTANRSDFVKSAKYRIGWPAGKIIAAASTRQAVGGRGQLQPQIAAGPSNRTTTTRPPGRRPRRSRPALWRGCCRNHFERSFPALFDPLRRSAWPHAWRWRRPLGGLPVGCLLGVSGVAAGRGHRPPRRQFKRAGSIPSALRADQHIGIRRQR